MTREDRPVPLAAPHRARRTIWPALIIVAAAWIAYHNTWHGPFVFDDASSIVTNPTLRELWPLTGPLTPPKTNVTAQGRPLLNLSLALNYSLGGTRVEGYHVVNLLLHACAGLALFGVVRRTLVRRPTTLPRSPGAASENASTWTALVIAVLWTAHPLQTESVTYVIQRAESLMGLWYLLTFYCFLRAVDDGNVDDSGRVSVPAVSDHIDAKLGLPTPRRTAWLGLSFAACLAGMATKEVMATAPLMMLLFDRTFIAGGFLSALRLRPFYYAGIFGTWLLLGWLVFQTGGNRGGSVGFGVGVAWWDYWLTQFVAIAHYLRLALWPHPLVFEYGSFWVRNVSALAAPGAIVLALLAVTLIGLWRRRDAGFVGAWFFGILAPTSLAPGTTQMIVEHRMYLPLAAVITLAVVALDGVVLRRRRWVTAGLAIGVSAAFLLLTVRRNDDYRTDVGLWRDTVTKRPANPLAHYMLAGAYERGGDMERAVASYEEALRLKPDFSIGHENLGELLLRQSRPADAIRHFETALKLQPELGDAHMNLGNALVAEGRVAEALPHLAEAARLTPDVAETHYNLAGALLAVDRTTDAIREFETALKYHAGSEAVHPAAHFQLGNALALSGRPAEAIGHYEAVLRSRPEFPDALHNLAGALFEVGRLEDAARNYEATLQIAPDFPHAKENLARVRARLRERRR